MAFFRDYKPVYSMDVPTYTAFVIKNIKDSPHKLFITKNEWPYNRYGDRANPVVTDHYTMFYTDQTDKIRLRHHIQEHKRRWYGMQEVPDDLKSIPLPHIHFSKIKNTT